MNGHVSQNGTLPDSKGERTRVQDRPNISVAELAALQRGYVERLGKLIEQFTEVMNRPSPPAAAMGSPAPPRDVVADVSPATTQDERLAKLMRTPLSNGDASYAVRTDFVRSTVAKVFGAARPAFVERGGATTSPYLEVVGTHDHEIAAAMAYAAHRWGNDGIIIHAGGRHTAKIIAHAVTEQHRPAILETRLEAMLSKIHIRERLGFVELIALSCGRRHRPKSGLCRDLSGVTRVFRKCILAN